MKCLKCGAEVENAAFCPNCGTALGSRKCPKCGREFSGGNFCPDCGTAMNENKTNQTGYSVASPIPPTAQSQPPVKKKKGCLVVFLVVLGILIIFGILVAAFSSLGNEGLQNGDSSVSNSSQKVEKKPDLEVIEYSSTSEEYVDYIVGKIKNNTKKTYSYAQISINLYKGENLVGSTLANINNLEPGAIWEFKAPVLYDDCDNFKIVEVTGF